jgi:hypothetical protein
LVLLLIDISLDVELVGDVNVTIFGADPPDRQVTQRCYLIEQHDVLSIQLQQGEEAPHHNQQRVGVSHQRTERGRS